MDVNCKCIEGVEIMGSIRRECNKKNVPSII